MGVNHNISYSYPLKIKKLKISLQILLSLWVAMKLSKPLSCYKYLGILIDENLPWRPQIDKMCSKLSSVCGALSKARHYLDRNSLMLIYNSLVESRIRYGILSWGTAAQQQINRVKVLQNKALRYITFSELDTPMLPIYSLLNVLLFNELLYLSQANFKYGYHHGTLPSNFQAYCSKPANSYPTRYSKSNFSFFTINS